MTVFPVRSNPPFASSFLSLGLPRRIALFGLLFAAEWIPLSDRVDRGRGLGSIFQFAVVFGAFFLGLLYVRLRGSVQRVSRDIESAPIGWDFLVSHFAAFLGAVYLAFLPLRTGSLRYAITALSCTAAVTAIGLAFCAFVPPGVAWSLIRKTGYTWAQAFVGGLIVWRFARSAIGNGAVWNPSIDLSWKPATDLTFSAVNAFLHLFLSQVVADRATMTIGGSMFNVTIYPSCAGLEGTALMLGFSAAWLWFFRKEFRFPAAFVLIPMAMVVMWISNAVRITVLILIGVAGLPDVAVGGFHSQAGWIAFTCVALSVAVLSLRLPWVTKEFAGAAPAQAESESWNNPTVACLMPVCAILAAGMISGAVSGGFEWLYPYGSLPRPWRCGCFENSTRNLTGALDGSRWQPAAQCSPCG